jgi:hypothetical protein
MHSMKIDLLHPISESFPKKKFEQGEQREEIKPSHVILKSGRMKLDHSTYNIRRRMQSIIRPLSK